MYDKLTSRFVHGVGADESIKEKESSENLTTLWRYLADSNRRTRFCRPLPSHSAKVPLWFAVAKVLLIFGLPNLYRGFL